jgi:four helix bundle protein
MVNPVVQELIDKTFRELEQIEKPRQRSRICTAPNAYIHLVAWSNASLLRVMVQVFTNSLPKSNYRLKNQLDDAVRSVVANVEEGFARPTTSEYVTFLGYSQASLVEVKGDIQRSRQDNLLPSRRESSLAEIAINLQDWHEALKKTVISTKSDEDSKEVYGLPAQAGNVEESKRKNNDQPQHVYTAVGTPGGFYGNLEEFNKTERTINQNQTHRTNQIPLKPFKFLYPPVDDLQASDLTYEIFIELINKTDWHLRKLVESLEDKLNRDQKFYQVEKARIRGKIKGF